MFDFLLVIFYSSGVEANTLKKYYVGINSISTVNLTIFEAYIESPF